MLSCSTEQQYAPSCPPRQFLPRRAIPIPTAPFVSCFFFLQELADLKARLLAPAKWAAISTDYCCLAEVFHEADDSAIKRCVSKVGKILR